MNTNGWDTVFATPVDTINDALVRSASRLVEDFNIFLGATTISGTFGNWSVVPGGSGKLLLLEIEIRSGTFRSSAGVSTDVAGMSVVQQISLQLLPSPLTPEMSHLAFNLTQVGAEGAGEGFISPHGVKDPAQRLTALQRSLLGRGVAAVLAQNASQVSFVLATINPAVLGGAEWMRPVKTTYCFQSPIGGSADLAILSVTSDRDTSQLPLQADPGLAGPSGSAGLAISPQLFLVNLFGPALATSFGKSFTLQPDGSIAATSIHLNVPAPPGLGASPPIVDLATARVSDATVIVDIRGHAEIGLGSSLTFTNHAEIRISFEPSSGKLSTAFAAQPVFTHELHQNLAVSIVLSIVPLGGALIAQVQGITENLIALAIQRTTDLSGIGAHTPDFVHWAGTGGFQSQEGKLETAFFVRGNLTPVVS